MNDITSRTAATLSAWEKVESNIFDVYYTSNICGVFCACSDNGAWYSGKDRKYDNFNMGWAKDLDDAKIKCAEFALKILREQ